jgi:hypothetical protein
VKGDPHVKESVPPKGGRSRRNGARIRSAEVPKRAGDGMTSPRARLSGCHPCARA